MYPETMVPCRFLYGQPCLLTLFADPAADCAQDPACTTFMGALLNYKGYHAIQAHRIAHVLWNSGRQVRDLCSVEGT